MKNFRHPQKWRARYNDPSEIYHPSSLINYHDFATFILSLSSLLLLPLFNGLILFALLSISESVPCCLSLLLKICRHYGSVCGFCPGLSLSRLGFQLTCLTPMSLFAFHFIVPSCLTIDNSLDLPSSSPILSLAGRLLILNCSVLHFSYFSVLEFSLVIFNIIFNFLLKSFFYYVSLKCTYYIILKSLNENLNTLVLWSVSSYFSLVFRHSLSFSVPAYNFTECRTLDREIEEII